MAFPDLDMTRSQYRHVKPSGYFPGLPLSRILGLHGSLDATEPVPRWLPKEATWGVSVGLSIPVVVQCRSCSHGSAGGSGGGCCIQAHRPVSEDLFCPHRSNPRGPMEFPGLKALRTSGPLPQLMDPPLLSLSPELGVLFTPGSQCVCLSLSVCFSHCVCVSLCMCVSFNVCVCLSQCVCVTVSQCVCLCMCVFLSLC